MKLHHVNVVVPPGCTGDVLGFYEILGLARIEKPTEGVAQTGAWFGFPDGSQQLHVSERSGAVNPDQHFAVVVADLDALVTRLRDDGHPFERKPDLQGARRGMTADPCGNAVELIEAT